MKILTLCAITVLGVGLIAGQAGASANFGSLTLKAGQTETVDMSTSARTMRVCNDSFSSGAVIATIGAAAPHDLSPGACAEEIGDRMTIQSKGSGLATVGFRSLSDAPGRRQLDD
jgi:hypothetical protein